MKHLMNNRLFGVKLFYEFLAHFYIIRMTDRLKCNFNMNDSLPGFFIHGDYTILDRAKAESQYCDSVRALTECEMLECQNWALNILASDFMVFDSFKCSFRSLY